MHAPPSRTRSTPVLALRAPQCAYSQYPGPRTPGLPPMKTQSIPRRAFRGCTSTSTASGKREEREKKRERRERVQKGKETGTHLHPRERIVPVRGPALVVVVGVSVRGGVRALVAVGDDMERIGDDLWRAYMPVATAQQRCNNAAVQQRNSGATAQQRCNSATVQQRNGASVQQCNNGTVQQ